MILEKTLTFPIKLLTGNESKDNITLTLKVKDANKTSNYIIHRAYLTQRLNERQGTASTLTKPVIYVVANPVRGLLDRKRSEEHLPSSNGSKRKQTQTKTIKYKQQQGKMMD